jgi:hypothetical protein
MYLSFVYALAMDAGSDEERENLYDLVMPEAVAVDRPPDPGITGDGEVVPMGG